MTEKILVMGLPGAGKTYFSERLKKRLEYYSISGSNIIDNKKNDGSVTSNSSSITCEWFNADDVRKKFDDWDFSSEGRIRQSLRMAQLAAECNSDYVICDFVAPLVEMRNNFKAHWVVWIDTIDQGRFEDTNKVFVPPTSYHFRITEQNAEKWVDFVSKTIIQSKENSMNPVQMTLPLFNDNDKT